MKFQNVNCRRYYEQEEKDWLIANYPRLGIAETVRQFNERFGRDKSVPTLKRYCVMHLGLKVEEERKANRYNSFTCPIGTVTENCRGEWKIKTDCGWIPVAHSFCDVPKGYVAIHLDGDKSNNSPENIAVVKNGIQTIMRNEGIWSEDADITRISIVWSELYKLLKN